MYADHLWKKVANSIEVSIKNRALVPGDKLPTEAEYSRKFMVNRHTLRKALNHLQKKGLIESTQGRGSYVKCPAIKYTIGKRVRFSEEVKKFKGKGATKTVGIDVVVAAWNVSDALKLKAGSKVVKLDRVGYINDQPISYSTHYFSFERFPVFLSVYPEHKSVTETLRYCGVLDFTRKYTDISARLPSQEECDLLNLPKHIPLILTRSLNVDPLGVPLEFGEALFASDRVEIHISEQKEICQPENDNFGNKYLKEG